MCADFEKPMHLNVNESLVEKQRLFLDRMARQDS